MDFYSEDNKYVASSIMLSSILDIIFVDSNTNIQTIIEDDNTHNICVYLDVVPDNKKLKLLYEQLIHLPDLKERNINIIPILCTEYYILKALYDLNVDFKFKYKWLSIVLEYTVRKISINKPYSPKSIGYKESFRRFEKQCKLLLANCSEIYLNFNTIDTFNRSELCEISWYLTDRYGISVRDKALLVAKYLPIAKFKNKLPYVFRHIEDVYKKCREIQEDYDKWDNNFNKINLSDNWWEDDNVDKELLKIR